MRSCFNRRERLAPMARRTVISWRRAKDLTSSRLPTLAHAMSKTNATTGEHDLERGEQGARHY